MAEVNIIKPIPALAKYVNYFWPFDADNLEDANTQYRIVADELMWKIRPYPESKSWDSIPNRLTCDCQSPRP